MVLANNDAVGAILGEIVRDNLAAPLHSHFGCFKVDLDGSGGEKLEATTITAGMKADVPELRGFATKYIVREHPEAEVAYRPSEIGEDVCDRRRSEDANGGRTRRRLDGLDT